MTAGHGRARPRRWVWAASGLAAAALVVGAVAEAATGTLPPVIRPAHAPAAGHAAPEPATALEAQFTAAASEFRVPLGVLMAVSYQETRWESHQGEPSTTGNYNVMGLTSVSPADLEPLTTAGKTADLAAARDGSTAATAPSSALLADYESVDTTAPALHTLDAAAALIQQPDAALRAGTRQSIRGGAALLASYEAQAVDGALPTDPGSWYSAVAQYSQGADAATRNQFADRVYATIASGASRTTDDGQDVALAADPSVVPRVPAASRAGAGTVLRGLAAAPVRAVPCEPGTATGLPSCALVPAARGNAETADRPGDGDAVRYIVLGGTGGSAASAVSTAADPASGVAAHFVVAADGAVTQQVPTRDVATQTGNPTVDDHAVEVQTEGFRVSSGSWTAEQEYASTADLVRNLAEADGIPLDRDHVLGQDDVPYPTASQVTAEHTAPGPSWDWGHFLDLLGVAPDGDGMPVVGGTVTIAPPYSQADKPVLTGCSGGACVGAPADFVYLRTAPSSAAPLLDDTLASSSGLPTAGTDRRDDSDKAVYGQTFVVADVSADGDWTAIWFGGRKAWFFNPGGANGYANPDPAQDLVSPTGSAAIPVYGRAYPEASAYTGASAASAEPPQPLPYTIEPGQAYVAAGGLAGDDYTYDGHGCTAKGCRVVIGTTQYEEIRYNHRIAYVLASDVQTTKPVVPPSGRLVEVPATRVLDTRDGTGGIPAAPVQAGSTVGLPLAALQPDGTQAGGPQPGGTQTVPASGVTAVTLEVTVLDPQSDGSLTVYPDGRRRPGLPTLYYTAGVTAPTPVTVPVVDGQVDFSPSADVPGSAVGDSVNLLVDLTGYVTMSGGGGPFHTTDPVRVLDTRTATDSSLTLQVAGLHGVPRGATAVLLNVTAADASGYGAITVHPYGSAVPAVPSPVDTVSFGAGEQIALQVTVPLVDGKVQFRDAPGTGPTAHVRLTADLVGYDTAP